jgi:hypothetical protein
LNYGAERFQAVWKFIKQNVIKFYPVFSDFQEIDGTSLRWITYERLGKRNYLKHGVVG